MAWTSRVTLLFAKARAPLPLYQHCTSCPFSLEFVPKSAQPLCRFFLFCYFFVLLFFSFLRCWLPSISCSMDSNKVSSQANRCFHESSGQVHGFLRGYGGMNGWIATDTVERGKLPRIHGPSHCNFFPRRGALDALIDPPCKDATTHFCLHAYPRIFLRHTQYLLACMSALNSCNCSKRRSFSNFF